MHNKFAPNFIQVCDSEYRAGRLPLQYILKCAISSISKMEIIGTPNVNDLLFCIVLLKASSSLYKFINRGGN